MPESLGELFSTRDIIFKARIKIQEGELISQERKNIEVSVTVHSFAYLDL